MTGKFVNRIIFYKYFALEYPEFIRFLKKNGVYKTFFRAIFYHGFGDNMILIPKTYDWMLLGEIFDRAFSWYFYRNDGMTNIKWSELKYRWINYLTKHIAKDINCKEKIKLAVWKTHMAMYNGQPLKLIKVALHDIWNGNFYCFF